MNKPYLRDGPSVCEKIHPMISSMLGSSVELQCLHYALISTFSQWKPSSFLGADPNVVLGNILTAPIKSIYGHVVGFDD